MNEGIPPQTPPSSEKKYGVHVTSSTSKSSLNQLWRDTSQSAPATEVTVQDHSRRIEGVEAKLGQLWDFKVAYEAVYKDRNESRDRLVKYLSAIVAVLAVATTVLLAVVFHVE
jgi:hypothetical protein